MLNLSVALNTLMKKQKSFMFKRGNEEPLIKRILTEVPKLTLPVWMSSHNELKTNPRVRFTFDLIAEEFHKYL